MNTLIINPDDGSISINKADLSFLSRNALINHDEFGLINPNEVVNNGVTTYSFEIYFYNKRFMLNASYVSDELSCLYMVFVDGASYQKGWDATENDLISDKNYLSAMLEGCFAVSPSHKNYSHDTFSFPWGSITAGCSLQSMVSTIGIKMNPKK